MHLVQWGPRNGSSLCSTFRQVTELLRNKEIVHRIPISSFEMSDVQKAFQQLQRGKHTGKIVVGVREVERIQVRLGYILTPGSLGWPLSPSEAAYEVLVDALRMRLADTFVLAPSDIEPGVPLTTYRLDSLVAVELCNWLGANVTSAPRIFDMTRASC